MPRIANTAATGCNAPLGAYDLPATPEERRSDQQWQRGRPTDGSSPEKPAPAWPHQPPYDGLSVGRAIIW